MANPSPFIGERCPSLLDKNKKRKLASDGSRVTPSQGGIAVKGGPFTTEIISWFPEG